ncbi:MAG: tRNA pseudouridine(55) synthase TruB [Thermomicrobiales bacterium]|nr:tRNA pseudouridine(55) synthase TruB [Thermomicrobiales bacterium]
MARRGRGLLHGYLVIDKPAGWTSHDVVARVRRLTGERKVGHAGTLDPAATGVLPVAVGLATRSLEFLSESSKSYLAEITFGVRTDSYDGDGTVLAVEPAVNLTEEDVLRSVMSFAGRQTQLPPMHSAIKIGGRRLYELARRGEEIEREPREITVHELQLIAWSPPVATVYIDCSKGTYIRSIAHDLGARLRCGAYLSNLVRLRTGPFTLDDAWTLDELAELDMEAGWPTIATHPDVAIEGMDALVIDAQRTIDWLHGKTIPAHDASDGWVRIYNASGDWLGIGHREPGESSWQPHKVISDAA